MEYYLVMLESFYDKIRDYHMELVKIENSLNDLPNRSKHQLLRKLLSDWDELIPNVNERIQEIKGKRIQRS